MFEDIKFKLSILLYTRLGNVSGEENKGNDSFFFFRKSQFFFNENQRLSKLKRSHKSVVQLRTVQMTLIFA